MAFMLAELVPAKLLTSIYLILSGSEQISPFHPSGSESLSAMTLAAMLSVSVALTEL
jgi:hypothetical protein